MSDIKHTDDWLLPKERLDLVSETNHEIAKLAEGMTKLLEIERNDDFLIYKGILARIQQLSQINFFALRLHGDVGAMEVSSWGEDHTDIKQLRRYYAGMM